jgi:transposase
MITITPQMKVRVHAEAIDFRAGIDGLAKMCRLHFSDDPFSGTLFLFRNSKSTAVKILVYDGQGFWCCHKRLSQGKFRYWPKSQSSALELAAREISILLFNGDPFNSKMSAEWRKVS